MRAILHGYSEVKSIISQVGRPDDGTDPKGVNNIEILADLKPRGEWRFASKEALVADMSQKDPRPARRADQFFAGDPGQRRRSAVRRQGRNRGQGVRPRPGNPDPEKRADRRHPVRHSRRRRRRGGQGRRPERTQHRDRSRTHRALGINIADVNTASRRRWPATR